MNKECEQTDASERLKEESNIHKNVKRYEKVKGKVFRNTFFLPTCIYFTFHELVDLVERERMDMRACSLESGSVKDDTSRP